MFRKVIRKVIGMKRLFKVNHNDSGTDTDLDLMKDVLLYRKFRSRHFAAYHVFIFFFLFSSVGKMIVSILQGVAFSPANLNELSNYLNNSGSILKQSLSWIVSLGWGILKIFPAQSNINVTFFTDYPDHLISFFYFALHSTLIYVHWRYIPYTLEKLYKKGNLMISEKAFLKLKRDFNKKYNSFYFKIISVAVTGTLIAYAYYVRDTSYSWWANLDYIFCALYFIASSFIIIYYMNLHVAKGFISVKLVNYATSRKKEILHVELMNTHECGGLKTIGNVIIQTFLSNTMTLSAILIVYLSNYLPIKHPLYIFYFAIMASFFPLFAAIPLYKIHKIMKRQKKEKLSRLASLSDSLLNNVIQLDQEKIDGKKVTKLCETNEKILNMYNSLNKVATIPFNYKIGILNVLLYLLQIAVILFEIIKKI